MTAVVWLALGAVVGGVAALALRPRRPPPGGTGRPAGEPRSSGESTARRLADRRLEKLNSALLLLGSDFDETVNRLTATAGELLGATASLYSRLEGESLCSVGGWNLPAAARAVDLAEGRLCADLIRGGLTSGVAVVRDLQHSDWVRSDPAVARDGLQTWAGCPVTLRGETLGSLCVVYTRDVEFTAADERILELVASAIAVEEERARTAGALREREEKYRQLFEATTDAAFVFKLGGDIMDCNDTACRMFGRAREQLLTMKVNDLVDDPLIREGSAQFAVDLATRGTVRETRARRYDGSVFPAEVSASLVRLQDKDLVVAYFRDVGDRRQADELQEATYEISQAAQQADNLDELYVSIHATLSRLMEASNLFIALHDPVSDLVTFPYWVDERDERPAPRRAGRGLTEYILRTGRPLLAAPEVFADLEARGEVESVGSPSIDWLGVPLIVRDQTIGVLAVQAYGKGFRYGERERDILTFVSGQVALAIERKRAEQLLRQSEEQYRTLVDNIQDGVFLVAEGRVMFANRAVGQMIGTDPASGRGQDFVRFVAPEDRDWVRERYKRRLAGEEEPREYELRLLHADGETRIPVNMSVSVIMYRGAPALLGTVRDLSEQRRLEERLFQSQKFEALGQLAGGIAHDFNNLLMAIQGSGELLRQRLPATEGVREELEIVQRSTRRAADLTQKLLAFARRQVLEPSHLDLDQVIGQLLPILERVIPENITISFRPHGRLATVRADRVQLEQILMNLALNSRDAMPDGGELNIATGEAELGDDFTATRPWARSGRFVHLSVRDTGVGIDSDALSHIFEPFYTTKEPGRGFGLGLAVVYGIVKQHGGMIEASSGPGRGTTIDIYFPQVAQAAERLEVLPVEFTATGGNETVLIVEDEAEVRHVLVEALAGLGYAVFEAADGVEALTLLERGEPPIQLVISDVVMPRMGGWELFEAAQRLPRRPRFLFSSGYGESLVDDGLAKGERPALITKPYGIDELARKVREVLEQPQTPAG
jgi:PAS domain S-box-containing protein